MNKSILWKNLIKEAFAAKWGLFEWIVLFYLTIAVILLLVLTFK
jgi:hypothetical protein